MAGETKVIQIDLASTIQQVVLLKQAQADLRAESEQLKKAIEGDEEALNKYGGSIETVNQELVKNEAATRANKKEQQALNKVIDTSIKENKAQAGSIEANRATLSRLTAEYIKLAKPTEEQTKRIKDLSDRLKEQEAAIGNDTRKVGSYEQAIRNATKGVKIFGLDVGETIGNLKEKQAALQGVTTGIGGTTKGLQVMRAALISTGIGAIVVALGFLINAFLSTQKGIDAMNKVLYPMQRVLVQVGEVLEDVAVKGFDRLMEAIDNPRQAIIDLGEAIQENLLNRIKAFAVAGTGLMKLATGDFKDGFKELGNSFIQLNTGIEDGIGKLEAFGNAASEVINQAVIDGAKIFDLQKRIKETERDQALSREEQLAQLAELKLAAADQTKSDEEKLKILTEAEALRRKIGEEDIKLAQQRRELFEFEKAGDMDLIETQLELNQLKAEEKKINREVAEDLKKITSQRTGIIQDGIEQEKKAKEDAKIIEEKAIEDRLKSQLDLSKQYFQEQRNVELENFNTGIIDEEEYQARLRDLQIDSFNDQLLILDTFNRDITQIELDKQTQLLENQKAYNEAKVKNDEEAAQKQLEINQQITEDFADAQQAKLTIAQAASDALRALLSLAAQQGAESAAFSKILALFQIGIDTARSISAGIAGATTSATATGPGAFVATPVFIATTVGTILGAFAQAVGILKSSNPPKAPKLAEGGEVNVGGKPHAQGGTMYVGEDGNAFEVERGEKIFVMKTTAAQAMDKYSRWNQLFGGNSWTGKGVKYAAQGGNINVAPTFDGGLSAREASNNVSQNVLNIPQPVVLVSEINRVQQGGVQSVQVSEL